MGHFSAEIMRLPGQLSVEINTLAGDGEDVPNWVGTNISAATSGESNDWALAIVSGYGAINSN